MYIQFPQSITLVRHFGNPVKGIQMCEAVARSSQSSLAHASLIFTPSLQFVIFSLSFLTCCWYGWISFGKSQARLQGLRWLARCCCCYEIIEALSAAIELLRGLVRRGWIFTGIETSMACSGASERICNMQCLREMCFDAQRLSWTRWTCLMNRCEDLSITTHPTKRFVRFEEPNCAAASPHWPSLFWSMMCNWHKLDSTSIFAVCYTTSSTGFAFLYKTIKLKF